MIIHVFSDPYGLFSSIACKRIEQLNASNNRCITIGNKPTIEHPKMEYVVQDRKAIKEYIATLEGIEKIVLHPVDYITSVFFCLFEKKFPHAKVYWIGWSYDIYNTHLDNDTFFEPYSFQFRKDGSKAWKRTASSILNSGLNAVRYPFSSKYYLRKTYKKVDFFGSFLKQDYENMKKIVKEHNIQFFQFSYLSIDEITEKIPPLNDSANGIIVGHASSLESNQYEILKIIDKLKVNTKILLPLAYGNAAYRNSLIEYVNTLHLSEYTEVLTQKLELGDYYAKLNEYTHAVYNLKIQQALGNILGLIMMGKKVFLREETSTYQEFVRLGLAIYSTNRQLNKKELSEKLPTELAHQNISILRTLFSEDQIKEYWNNIVS